MLHGWPPQIVPADYAFVLHTADPVTGTRGETHGELVRGPGAAATRIRAALPGQVPLCTILPSPSCQSVFALLPVDTTGPQASADL